MIFAVADYVCYTFRIGRYSPKRYEGTFSSGGSEHMWAALKEGDMLFIMTPGSWLSWIVMYVASTPFSHVAVYVGHRKIAHMTTAGFAIDDVGVLEKSNCYVMPILAPVDPEDRGKLRPFLTKYINEPYGWITVIGRGWRILFARDLPAFRLKFFADGLCVLGFFNLGLIYLTNRSYIFVLVSAYLAIIGLNIARFIRGPNNFEFVTPYHLYTSLIEYGGRRFVNGGKINDNSEAFIATDMYVFFEAEQQPDNTSVVQALADIGFCCSSPLPALTGEKVTLTGVSGQGSDGELEIWLSPSTAVEAELALKHLDEYRTCVCVKSDVEYSNIIAAFAVACALTKATNGLFYNPGFQGGLGAEQIQSFAVQNLKSMLEIKKEFDARRFKRPPQKS